MLYTLSHRSIPTSTSPRQPMKFVNQLPSNTPSHTMWTDLYWIKCYQVIIISCNLKYIIYHVTYKQLVTTKYSNRCFDWSFEI